MVLDVVELSRAAVEVVEKERSPVAEASRHRQNDVSIGRNAGALLRRSGGSHRFWRSWYGAAVRVCHTFWSPS